MKNSLTAVVITKNEVSMIEACLETLAWCEHTIVLDQGSEDETVTLAKKAGAKVIVSKSQTFAEIRTEALTHVTTDWLMYIDADERVTPELAKEIETAIVTTSANAMLLHRQNMLYGRYATAGGWQNEWVPRIFRRSALKKWTGKVHESPVYDGQTQTLQSPLLHLTHRNTVDGLRKTAAWTPIEAELFVQAGVAPVTGWTLVRKSVMEVLRRLLLQGGYRDGMEGWVEALVQGANRLLVYVQIWEKQQHPPLVERYRQEEQRIATLWKKKAETVS